MTNNKLKLSSLILAVALTVSTVFSGIQVNAAAGSGYGGVSRPNSHRQSGYSSHSSKKGVASTTYGFRIQAFDVEEFSGGDYSYFTVSNAGAGDKVALKANVLNSVGHSENNDWRYFTPLNKSRTYSFYVGGDEFTAKTIGTDSPEMNELKSILGVSSLSYFDGFDAAFQAYDKIGTPEDKLAEFFGITPGHYYFFVVEGLMAMYDPDAEVSGTDYSNKFIFTSYQDYHFDSNAKKTMSCNTAIDSSADAFLNNPEKYINQGSRAPFELGWISGQPIKTGYCVYGDINGSNSTPISLNIAVEYQGNPNTTDGEFKVATSLIKQEGSEYNWWSIGEGKWKKSSDFDTILQTSAKGVVSTSPYAVVMEDTYWIKSDTNNTTASKLINAGDACNSGYSLVWGNTQVNSGDANVGFTIKPTALDGKTSTSSIMNKFLANVGNNMISGDRNKNNNYANLSILDAMIDNVNRAYSKTDVDAIGTVKSSKEAKLNKSKKLGTAIEFIVKGAPVTSHKVTVQVSNGIASSSETWSADYNSASSAIANIDAKAVCYLVVANANRNDEAVNSALSGVDTSSATTVLNTAKSALTGVKLNQVAHGINVGVGCEPNLDGYTIYEILVDNEVVVGDIELPAYMLNRYFQNIIQTSSKHQVLYQLNKDFTIIKENYTGSESCGRCGAVLEPINKPADFDDWRVEWKDTSAGTYHTDLDNQLRSRYFVNMESGVWAHSNRIDLANWVSEDTRNFANPSGLILDYGFNLIRASVDDKRSISGISYTNYEEVDSDNLLQIKNEFGVVPAVVKPASPKRNSKAVVGTLTETLKIESRFTRYSGTGYNEQLENHSHAEEGHWEGEPATYHVDSPAVSISYYSFPIKTALGIRENASPINTMTYSWTNTVYKYSTDALATGKNTILGGANSKAISNSASKVNNGIVSDDNEYRFATVRDNGVILNFYPEVLMVDCIAGTNWSSVQSEGYHTVYTMGEELRKAQSSSLYLFKINGDGENAVTGTTFSDSMLGGSNTLDINQPIIPAGADVNVAADLNGIDIDLYAYTLDIIDKSVDSTFKTSATTSRSYEEVVKSGANVYQKWLGASNLSILKNAFKSWSDDILDVRNFGADFSLYVNNDKKSSNFSATVGDIKKTNEITEDGVWQLVVKKGMLIENSDYTYMIKQIASDYQVTESEAEDLFKASGIYTAILEAIESCNDSFNKSGVCEVNPNWTSVLGNSTNFYDEQVHTFVIRRFTLLNNKICDVIAQDKIDYNLAPNGNLGTSQNANAGNNNNASWKLTVYFDKARASEVNDNLLGSATYYEPNTGAGLESANDSYSVLMKEVPVQKADFKISADSTSIFGY